MIPKSILSGIDLLKMHSKSTETEGTVLSKFQRILVPGMNLLKKTYDGGECQAQWCLRSQNQYHGNAMSMPQKIIRINDRFIENLPLQVNIDGKVQCLNIASGMNLLMNNDCLLPNAVLSEMNIETSLILCPFDVVSS